MPRDFCIFMWLKIEPVKLLRLNFIAVIIMVQLVEIYLGKRE